MLNMTPPERLLDDKGRPYFLWDVDMDLEQFRKLLEDPDPQVRGYILGKLMREARPDDVFQFVSLRTIRNNWDDLHRHLGRRLEFWRWLLRRWEENDATRH